MTDILPYGFPLPANSHSVRFISSLLDLTLEELTTHLAKHHAILSWAERFAAPPRFRPMPLPKDASMTAHSDALNLFRVNGERAQAR